MSKIGEKRVYILVKRMIDVVLAVTGLAVSLPLMLLFGAIIWFQSPGDILYTQWRVGYKGRQFRIYKLRSMVEDAEHGIPLLSEHGDERITPIGRFMRRYHLDELPNLWNVAKGDMAIVGPRPEREYFIEKIKKFVPDYDMVHQVRPGMTSWGMVKYGYATNVPQMVKRFNYDLLYVRNLSPSLDMKIIYHTVCMLGKGKGI